MGGGRYLRTLALASMIGALGNVLFLVSQTVKFGGEQVVLDLSHIGTLVAALYGGPTAGLLAGILVVK